MNCKRCGLETNSSYIAKRIERGLSAVCSDCAARRRRTLQTAYGICFPHQGDFDEQDNPLDRRGRLKFPGERLCGFRDCVNPLHIQR